MEGEYLNLYGQLKSAILILGRSFELGTTIYSNVELWQERDDCLTLVIGTCPTKAVLGKWNDDDRGTIAVQCFLLCSNQEGLLGNTTWNTYMLLLQSAGNKNEYIRVGVAIMHSESRGGWFDDCSRQRLRLI